MRQAKSKVDQAQNEREEIQQKSDSHMNERHDLQVFPFPVKKNLKAKWISLMLTFLCLIGPATPDKGIRESSRNANR